MLPSEQSKTLSLPGTQFSFMVVWWLCFLLYPNWYLPGLEKSRLLVCAAIFALFVFQCFLFRWLADYARDEPPQQAQPLQDRFFFATLFSLNFILHLPFLPKPILAGLDTIDHAAVPALVANSIVTSLSEAVGFSLRPLFLLLAIVLLFLAFYPPFVRSLWQRLRTLINLAIQHWLYTFLILFLFTMGYAFLLVWTAYPQQFGDLSTLFRYQPISKMILIPVYILFGLREFLGRFIQLMFFYAGAVYLYKLTALYGGREASRVACILYLFLPPIFHYGNTHMIEGGTLFFILASYFHYVRYMETKRYSDLIIGTLWTVMGCLYKHPAVSLIPGLALMTAYDFLFPRKGQVRRFPLPEILSCTISSLTFLLYMKLSAYNQEVPSSMHFPTLERMLTNLSALTQGVTWPIALLFLAGLIFLLARNHRRIFILIMCWVGAHFVLTVMSATFANVRQALPYYLGLIVPAALFLEWLGIFSLGLRKALIYGVLPLFLLWTCLFMDREQLDPKTQRAMGDRSYITFTNWEESYLPYDEAMRTLKNLAQPGDIVYAPMANEPVHFYLQKHDVNHIQYIRQIWEPDIEKQSLESFLEYVDTLQADWVLIPMGRWLLSYVDLNLIHDLEESPPEGWEVAREFTYGKERMRLWRVNQPK